MSESDPNDVRVIIAKISDLASKAMSLGAPGHVIDAALSTLATAPFEEVCDVIDGSRFDAWDRAAVVLGRLLVERDDRGTLALEHACGDVVLEQIRGLGYEGEQFCRDEIARIDAAILRLAEMKSALVADLAEMQLSEEVSQ